MSKTPGSVDYTKVGQQEPRDAYDAAAVEAALPISEVHRPWHYTMCTTCTEMNSCLEGFLCTPCQLSRQFNMLYNLQPDIHYPVCLAVLLLDMMGVPAGFALEYVLRSDIRRRYGIEGNIVSDCLTSWLCAPCAVQQQFLEMTSIGSCPGMSMVGVSPVLPEGHYMV